MEIKGFENYLVHADGKVYNKKAKHFMKVTKCINKNSQVVNLTASDGKTQRTFTIRTLVGKYYLPKGGIPVFGNPKYLIYEDGKVWSVSKGDYLKSTIRGGYRVVNLRLLGKKTYLLISRLVALHFHSNDENLPCVDHKDRDKLNNHKDNLRFVSIADNNRNRGKQKNNTSGYAGIRQNEWGNWKACININCKTKSKTFKKIEEAIEWRKNMVELHYNRPEIKSA